MTDLLSNPNSRQFPRLRAVLSEFVTRGMLPESFCHSIIDCAAEDKAEVRSVPETMSGKQQTAAHDDTVNPFAKFTEIHNARFETKSDATPTQAGSSDPFAALVQQHNQGFKK